MASVPGPNHCLDNRYFKLGVRLTLFLSFHTRLQESQKPVRNQSETSWAVPSIMNGVYFQTVLCFCFHVPLKLDTSTAAVYDRMYYS